MTSLNKRASWVSRSLAYSHRYGSDSLLSLGWGKSITWLQKSFFLALVKEEDRDICVSQWHHLALPCTIERENCHGKFPVYLDTAESKPRSSTPSDPNTENAAENWITLPGKSETLQICSREFESLSSWPSCPVCFHFPTHFPLRETTPSNLRIIIHKHFFILKLHRHIFLKLYHIVLHFLNFICYVMYYPFIFNLFKLTVSSQYDIVKFIHVDICSGIPLGDIKFDSPSSRCVTCAVWDWCVGSREHIHTGPCLFSSGGKRVSCIRDVTELGVSVVCFTM